VTGEPLHPCPKPTARVKEPKRLKQIGEKKAAAIAAGAAHTGMKRSFIRPKPPRRLETEDAGRMQFARESMCVVRELPGHICVGRMQASHERNPQGGPPTGGGRKEDARLTVGMCTHGHIAEWEEHAGAFAGWSKQQRHDFMLLHYTALNEKWDALEPSQREWWQEHAAVVKAQWREAMRGLR